MRILMITPNFPPEANPEAIVNGKLALALRGQGAEVAVISRTYNSAHFGEDDSKCWGDLAGDVRFSPQGGGGRGERAATYLTRLRRMQTNCSWFVDRAASLGARMFAERPFDVILTRSGMIDGLVVGRLLQKKFRRPWFATLNDPLPLCLIPPPYGPGHAVSWRDRFEVRRLAELLRYPDRVVVPCRRLGDYMARSLGVSLVDRMLVSYHIGWRRDGSPDSSGRFELLYAGTMGLPRVSTRMLLDFFRLARSVPGCAERIKLVFLGQAARPFVEWVRDEGLTDFITLEPPVGYEASLDRIARAGALLLMEGIFTEGIFFPSKFSDYALARKPLVMFSPEAGTIADFVGGRRHPGFWGQEREGYLGAMARFLEAVKGGEFGDYLYATPGDFEPEAVARGLLAAMC